MVTSTVQQAREALGERLRDLRRDTGLTGRGLAALAGWHSSNISKIEYGKQSPSEDDIRIWCRLCHAGEQTDDIIVAVRDIETMYVEWRRRLRTGTRSRQQKSQAFEADAGISAGMSRCWCPGCCTRPSMRPPFSVKSFPSMRYRMM